MKLRYGILIIFLLAGLSTAAIGDTVKGRIKSVSNKANTIQLEIKKKPSVVVHFDAGTVIEGAEGIDDLNPPDLIEVEYEPGQPATRIKKIVFGLPEGVEIGIQELLAILQGQRGPYLLGDARPKKRFVEGHIPSAVSTPAVKAEALLAKLPEDKDRLLVFYCGGPTCPFTKKAYDIATEAGYTNVKGFQAGMPGWKKNQLPVHVNRGWMAKNLDEHHILIDVRDPAEAAKLHLPTAVSLPTGELQRMTDQFIRTQKLARLPGVTDTRSPIILYGDTHADREVLLAYKELRSWGYTNVGILEGGLQAWTGQELPTASNALAQEIRFVKALPPGAIAPAEFMARVEAPEDTVFVDVRTDAELAQQGKMDQALHIPLDQLESHLAELPKDKTIVTFCENGIRAEMAHEALRARGYRSRFLNETPSFHDGDIAL